MLKRIKSLIIVAVMSLGFGAPALVPAMAFAATDTIQNSLCQGTNIATGGGNASTDCTTNSNTGVSLSQLAARIVNILSIVVGVVAVIMIIVGGFRYITSGGESGNVSGAKNTLIYAIVGLVIVALAQFIVHYVLNTATNSVSTT